ncbi:MAG: hypothetical protein O2894_09765 [Planctomycetota bacterium]|nr:hypothetical protein [Planctomycetota bacterium]
MAPRTLLQSVLVLVLACGPAWAEEPWEKEAAFHSLVKVEIKTLQGLLQDAVKKDHRRQAWYLADRLLQLDPADAEATAVIDRWNPDELQLGQAPKKAFLQKRDSALRELGDNYFHFGETLEASGMDPVKYYPIQLRAHGYGSKAGALVKSLADANYVWLGVYGPQPKDEVEKYLQGPFTAYVFPQEYDDDYLAARVVWPEARGAQWRGWRLLTDHDHKEALRLLGMLAAADRWMGDEMGSKAKKDEELVTDLLVFGEWQKYDKIAGELVRQSDRPRFEGTSGWYDRQHERVMVCWRHRHNGWLGDDDLMLGHAAKIMARNHFAPGAGGSVQGRGYWLLEGLRGAFEGFRVNEDGKGEIDPASCWRLALARALRDSEKLLPWEEFFDLDQEKGEAIPRVGELKVRFGGADRDAKAVDVVAAQATALVVGLMKADQGKALKKFGALLGDLYKRDSLPDVDKALGLKKGKAVAMAGVAMDSAHGGASK